MRLYEKYGDQTKMYNCLVVTKTNINDIKWLCNQMHAQLNVTSCQFHFKPCWGTTYTTYAYSVVISDINGGWSKENWAYPMNYLW